MSYRGPDTPIVITQESWDSACADPKVKAFNAEARAYAKELVERGHCPCHLLVNCPQAGGPS